MAKKFLSAVDFLSTLLLGGSAGTSGDVLTSQGAGSPPIWQAPTGGAASLPSNVIAANTTIAADTSYVVASYLKVDATLTVNGTLLVSG